MVAIDLISAHRLAQYIEWSHAKDRAKLARARVTVDQAYDPLAATCLGDLIYSVGQTGRFEERRRHGQRDQTQDTE